MRKRDYIPWSDELETPGEVTLVRRGIPSGSGVFRINHVITELEPSEDYEVTVRVENRFGWSNWSDVFHFYTRKSKLTETMVQLKILPPAVFYRFNIQI